MRNVTSWNFLGIFAHLTALVLLFLSTYRLASNLHFLRWVRRQASEPPLQPPLVQPPLVQPPLVSVLIPARNEEATIVPCVTSLLEQEYPNYELIVLNDGSIDDTGAQLNSLATMHPRLKVIHADEKLPAGWNGKSYACHRLAEQAKGEWMLFTDADTQHSPKSIALGVAQAIVLNCDLLSAFPYQQTVTWIERIIVSFIIDFLPLIGLDFRAIYCGTGTHSAANGQYLLARTAAYCAAGGHAAIYNETLDDFALAKHFRINGYKIALIDGKELLHCRMYRNARELWNGFSRSLMLGLDNSSLAERSVGWAALFVWGYASIFVNPFYTLFFKKHRWLPIIEILWLGLLRGFANWHLKRPLSEILTTPLAAWGVMALGLGAVYRRWQGQKISWKGRLYTN